MYLVVDDKGASAAEAPDGGHGVLHVGADQVDVVNLSHNSEIRDSRQEERRRSEVRATAGSKHAGVGLNPAGFSDGLTSARLSCH